MITLLLIDDHFVVRSGLVASLELEDDLKVVGEADRGEDASRLFAQTKPDVVLMDIQLPGLSGIDATAALLREHPAARVLIFSTFARDDEIHTALKAGALGYLQKSSSRDALLAAPLGSSEDNVRQHVSRILMKLKVNDCAQAAAEAIKRWSVALARGGGTG